MISAWAQRLGCMAALGLILSACTVVHQPQPSLPSRASIEPGESITVKGYQNVYAVAHEYNASMREIIVLNNLQPPFALKPGQHLVLPAKAGEVGKGLAQAPASPLSGSVEKVQLAPLAPVEAAPVQPPVATPQVEALNAPAPPPKPIATTVAAVKPTPAVPAAPAVAPPPQPAPTPAAAPSAPAAPTKPPVAASPTSVSMIWPVQGPILSPFGPKGQGLNNDGVNIGAPKGAPVVAAAGGMVVYAGNEMKGFGNLILIRHEGGWVTAYAHMDRMLVSKDAVVAQGDMIATVGKTGNVPSPQLHFETRSQGKPVDPAGVIKP